MNMTTGKRVSDGGSTMLTIADGLVYVDVYRGHIHVEQRVYDATDLVNMNLDTALMAGTSTRQERSKRRQGFHSSTQENV